jgi:hypothetical protein
MRNPFADDEPLVPPRENPFGDDEGEDTLDAALLRIDHAARRVRQLQSQLGAEGLTISASRQMMTELSLALEAVARALRHIRRQT